MNATAIKLFFGIPYNGGEPIEKFTVEQAVGQSRGITATAGDYTVALIIPWVGDISMNGTSTDVGYLLTGFKYWFTVFATNKIGDGPKSVDVSRVAANRPGPPQQIEFSNLGQHSVDLNWVAPLDDGGSPVVRYDIEWIIMRFLSQDDPQYSKTDDRNQVWNKAGSVTDPNEGMDPDNPTGTSFTVSGMDGGQKIKIRIFASNAAGTGVPGFSYEFRTEQSTPSKPDPVDLSDPLPSFITSNWKEPIEGGTPITLYKLQQQEVTNYTYTGSKSGYTYNELEPTTPQPEGVEILRVTARVKPTRYYRFRVAAKNSLGFSEWSEWSVIQLAAATPTQPLGTNVNGVIAPKPTVDPFDATSMKPQWSEPASNGGDAICGYEVEYMKVAPNTTNQNGIDRRRLISTSWQWVPHRRRSVLSDESWVAFNRDETLAACDERNASEPTLTVKRVTGLENKKFYKFRIRAYNGAGNLPRPSTPSPSLRP